MVEKYYNEYGELGVLYSPGFGIVMNSHMIEGLLSIG